MAQHARANEILPRLPRDLLDQLPRDGIEDIVIGIGRPKTRHGFEVSDALDGLLARQMRARHEHQVALPQSQPAAMHEQVADRDLARHPGVIHAKPGHMLDDGVVPRDLAFVYQRSEEHTSELQSLMRISYAVFCLKTNKYT